MKSTVGLGRGLGNGATQVTAVITGDVVPDHFDAGLRNRKGVVAISGEIGQAIAVIGRCHIQGAALGRFIHLRWQRCRAMARIDRDPVGLRVALEHGDLAIGQLVLVLLDRRRGDDEQRFFIGERIGQEAFAVHRTGIFGMPPVQGGIEPAALPAFSAPSGVRLVPSLFASSADTAAITLTASRLRARAVPNCRIILRIEFILFQPGQKFTPKLNATKSRSSSTL